MGPVASVVRNRNEKAVVRGRSPWPLRVWRRALVHVVVFGIRPLVPAALGKEKILAPDAVVLLAVDPPALWDDQRARVKV